MSDLLAQINNAAHQGAFGQNPRSEPTLAQLAAGNYKKGVVMVKGLSIAIENPAYTYRKGIDKSGQQWMCLMQAHYGYIQGHKGNDGDEMDVFIGNVPENDTVYIVNQKTADGYFDEHKIMLGFLSQQQAVDTYQHCFERGWTGLMSVVPCTMTQFKWWLANGDKSRPVTLDRLPYAGLERLDSVIWGGNDGSDLASHSGQVHKLLYQIRQCDDTHQALEPLSYNDLVQELGNQGFMYENYDALVVEYNKLEKKAKQLLMVMQGAASTVKPVTVAISKPLTKGGVANVVAWFEMDDGQAVGVFFHNPDKTPKKIDPTDEMISYKWVLNKKDITIAVAPEQGKDLIIRTVAKRIMQLVEKNHDRFIKANGDKAALNQAEQDLTAQVAEKQATLKGLQDDVAALQAKKAEKDAFTLQSQTEADLRQREAEAKAAEAERLAQEKAAKDKAQADKDAADFRLTGSNLPADVAAAGGQQDLLAGDNQNDKEDVYSKDFDAGLIAGVEKKIIAGGWLKSKESGRWFSRDMKFSLGMTNNGGRKTASYLVVLAISDDLDGVRTFTDIKGGNGELFFGKYSKNPNMTVDEIYEFIASRITQAEQDAENEAFVSTSTFERDDVDKNKYRLIGADGKEYQVIWKSGFTWAMMTGETFKTLAEAKQAAIDHALDRKETERQEAESRASATQKTTTITEERPSNWRTNLANARAVAKSLGIETKGKKLSFLVSDIAKAQAKIKHEQQKQSMIDAVSSIGGTVSEVFNGGESLYFTMPNYPFPMQLSLRTVFDDFTEVTAYSYTAYYGDNGQYKTQGSTASQAINGLYQAISASMITPSITEPTAEPIVNPAPAPTEPAPAMPTQEDQDREFLLSAIEEKINILDAANVNKLAELSKVYTQGDMNSLIKQAKQVAIDAIKRSMANATAKMN